MTQIDEERLKKILEEYKKENPEIKPKDYGLVKNVKEDNFNWWDITKDMAMSVPEAGVNFVEFTGDFLERNIPIDFMKGPAPLKFDGWGDGVIKTNDFIPRILRGEEYAEEKKKYSVDERQLPHFHKAETWQGDMTERVFRFIFGLIGPTKGLKAAGVTGKINTVKGASVLALRGTTSGAIADATVWDPNEGRMSDWLIEFDSPLLNNRVTQYLASDDDDTANEAALKNVLEGMIPGIAAELIIGIRAVKAAKQAKTAEAKQAIYKEADSAIKDKQKIRKLNTQRAELLEKTKQLANETDKVKIDQLTKRITSLAKKIHKIEFKTNKAIKIKDVDKKLKVTKKTAKKDVESFFGSILNVKAFRSGVHVLRTIDQLSEHWDDSLKTYLNSDVLTNEAAKDLANILAIKPEELLKALPKISAEADQGVIRMLATKKILNDLVIQFRDQSAIYVKSFGKDRKAWSKDALDDVARYSQIIRETVTGLKKQIRGAARTTQAGNIKGLTGTGKLIDVQKAADTILNFKGDAVTIANKIANLKDVDEILEKVAKTKTQKAIEVTNSVYINSLLSGIWTHAVNMTSGLYEIAYVPLEIIGGGALRGDLKTVRLGFAQYRGMIMNFRQTLKMTALAFRQGDAVLDPLMRTQDNLEIRGGRAVRPISADNLGFNGKIGTVVDWFGHFLELPSRLLLTGDEVLKQINFNGRLYANAVENTLERGYKLNSKAAKENIEQIMNNALKENGTANIDLPIVADALESARKGTFTNALKDGSYRNWGSAIEAFFNRVPELRFIAPFIRTPTNLWRHFGNRIPGLGAFTKQNRTLWNSGDPRARAEVIGRQMFGMAATMYAVDLAYTYVELPDGTKLPKLTGRGPADKATQNLWRKTGWQPYSILVDEGNGKFVYKAYNRLDPRFFVKGIIADLVENSRNINKEDKYNLFAAAVLSTMRGVTDKSYTRGIAEAFELMGDLTPANLEKFAGNVLGNFIPYASMRAQGIPFILPKDKNVYETRDWVDKIVSKTPFAEKFLEKKRDVFGEHIERNTTGFWTDSDGILSWFTGPTGIGQKSELDLNRDIMELASLKIGLTAPEPVKFKIVDLRDFKNKRYEKDGKQSAYDYWQEQIGKVKWNGKTIKEYYAAEFKKSSWRMRQSGDLNFDGGKEMMAKKIYEVFKKKAYAQMIKEYPEVKEAIKAAQKTKGGLLKSDQSGTRLDKTQNNLEKVLMY